MLRACVQRFDVTENLKILAKFLASKRLLMLMLGSSLPRFRFIIITPFCWLLIYRSRFGCRPGITFTFTQKLRSWIGEYSYLPFIFRACMTGQGVKWRSVGLQCHWHNFICIYTTPSIPNYNLFDFFDLKFDRSSYWKNSCKHSQI
jgi:hypothetical protein